MSELCVRNRQRLRPVHLPLLRRVVRALLRQRFPSSEVDLGVYLVAAPEMARLNETFLHHPGSTDVITFCYSEPASARSPDPSRRPPVKVLSGEIVISIDDALRQARQFRTSWQSEVIRYLVHGLLHLQGYEDLTLAARRVMKREEDRLVEELARRFPLSDLGRKPRL